MASNDSHVTRPTRRDFLKVSAGLAAAGVGMPPNVAAQIWGTTGRDGGGSVPLRKSPCILNYLDPKEYIHNMEIISYVKAPGAAGNDSVGPVLWAKGERRVLVGMGVDITDPKKPVVAMKPIGGVVGGPLGYATHLKKWIAVSMSGRAGWAPNPEYPRGQYHMAYRNHYFASTNFRGIRTYDITDPARPVQLGELGCGDVTGGFYDGGKYFTCELTWDDRLRMESTERPVSAGLGILDVADPAQPKVIAKWWVPGQMIGEETEYYKWPFADDQSSWTGCHGGMVMPRRPEDGGTVGYCGMGAFGMYIMDVTDITKPKPISRLGDPVFIRGGIPWHTMHPIEAGPSHPRLQNLLIATFEPLESDCQEPARAVYVVDVNDKRKPKIVGWFPAPKPAPDAPYPDFCCARGRVGSHIIQAWAAPGENKPDFAAITYYNAGLRIFDLSDPTDPKEVAYFVPARRGDINKWETFRRQDGGVFVEWDRNLIWFSSNYVGEQEGGLYCMSTPLLGKPILEPRKVTRWTVPHINRGWDDQTPVGWFFGRGLSRMT